MPQSVSRTSLEPEGLLQRLRRIPGKITAYFDRSLIDKVYRSNHERNTANNYYVIVAIDGTKFHIDYTCED